MFLAWFCPANVSHIQKQQEKNSGPVQLSKFLGKDKDDGVRRSAVSGKKNSRRQQHKGKGNKPKRQRVGRRSRVDKRNKKRKARDTIRRKKQLLVRKNKGSNAEWKKQQQDTRGSSKQEIKDVLEIKK